MIIKSIAAENILKYRKLELSNIPSTGQIAVAGPNESGKTAIGETICFALFGRTFSLGPSEVTHVIRWGEFRGSARMSFTGHDGADFLVAREIDNNGRHTATLYQGRDKQVVAKGPGAVLKAVREVCGFTYQSFIDSFYLAQREMEVPHAKSATVKALIGVDRLESVTADLTAEMTTTAKAIRALDGEIRKNHEQIAEIRLDRSHLGRLESQRDLSRASAKKGQARAADLAARAKKIAKAAESFVEAAETFVETSVRTTHVQWRQRKDCVAVGLSAAVDAANVSHVDVDTKALQGAKATLQVFEHGLTQFDKVRDLADLYRKRLQFLLGSDDDGASGSSFSGAADDVESRFSERRTQCMEQVDQLSARRRPLLGFAIFLMQLAVLCGASWAVLFTAADSAVGGLLQAALPLGDTVRQLVLVGVGLISGIACVALFIMHARTSRALRIRETELANIESAIQTAKDEISVIDALDDASMSDALNAIRGIHDHLLHSAVVAFAEGDGAIFVKRESLAQKLDELKQGSAQATKSLLRARKRIAEQSVAHEKEAVRSSAAVVEFEKEIAVEKERFESVEALERVAAGFDAQAASLRQEIAVRKLACELIEGACRRIYARFHPELRRFVGKILPHLTEERYQHLELDDDLRIRVFCNEKNDFVGLAEISNGTHRQLMLCVRLALSQALIASSSKAVQFIFFDEPFAFFDERRMARAIDVLGKISPQITQVWLAAQTFQDRSEFDMFIDCTVDNDTLIMAGTAPTAKQDVAQTKEAKQRAAV